MLLEVAREPPAPTRATFTAIFPDGRLIEPPSYPAESNMVDMNELHTLDVEVIDPCTCSGTEQFSGYIITTSSNSR